MSKNSLKNNITKTYKYRRKVQLAAQCIKVHLERKCMFQFDVYNWYMSTSGAQCVDDPDLAQMLLYLLMVNLQKVWSLCRY